MKKILVMLFFSLPIQCGKLCLSLLENKMACYEAQYYRFQLQTSIKELKSHGLETYEELLKEIGGITTELALDILDAGSNPGDIRYFYLNKLLFAQRRLEWRICCLKTRNLNVYIDSDLSSDEWSDISSTDEYSSEESDDSDSE